MSNPVYALNLSDISSKDEYLAYSRRPALEVEAHGGRVVTEVARESVTAWVLHAQLRSANYLFPGRGEGAHLSARQYARIVKAWVGDVGLDPSRFGTHSLRRTKATLIYKRTKNIRAIQLSTGPYKA